MAFSSNPSLSSFHYQIASIKNQPQCIRYKLTKIMSMAQDQNLILASATTKQLNYLVGDRYNIAKFPMQHDDLCITHAQKLKAARGVFKKSGEDPLERLIMIDALQRLGIDYHFSEDIEAVLWSQYKTWDACSHHQNLHLFEVALRFRLLRQHGYHVPADVFTTFMNNNGKFKQNLAGDTKGLMGLYEASQFSMEGENILDEAGHFSCHHLNAKIAHLKQYQAKTVANTLKYPYHRTFTRFMVKYCLNNFQSTNKYQDIFVQLAKLDFNMIQSINQGEIVQISKWWKELGLAEELKFARNQPLKWYMWSMVSLTDPGFSKQRVELAKPISLVYIIDDIFDLRGSLDELILFTEAVDRWEIAATEKLPDHMKICFKALYDITNEVGFNVYKKLGWNPTRFLQKSWTKLCNAFLVEAKWFASGTIPKAQEYLKNGIVTSGVHVILVHAFFLLSEGVTEEMADLVNEIPDFISSVSKILRLWDDLGSAKNEKQDGHDGSYVECYMRECPGMSVEEAREYVKHMISETWKRLNQECLSPNPFSATLTNGALNAARTIPLMYNYNHDKNLPSLDEFIKSLLFESISI